LAIAGAAKASALAAPKIALRMDVAPFLIPFFVALWKKTRKPVVRFMNACSARKRAGYIRTRAPLITYGPDIRVRSTTLIESKLLR
jgi:hypothetical protein